MELARELKGQEIIVALEQGLIMYRHPPGESALAQLDEPLVPRQQQGQQQNSRKRPRSDNVSFSVKRFKGPVMSQIFGAGASLGSRQL